MAKTFTQLQEAADLIKNETADGANTAERVGGTIRDIVDKIESIQNYNIRISKCVNTQTGMQSPPNDTLEVSLDHPLADGYKIVMMRRKKVNYILSDRRRKLGYGYRLVNAKGGFTGDGDYRGRLNFLRNIRFSYKATSEIYYLGNTDGNIISPFEFAKHYTEILPEDTGVRISAASNKAKFLYNFHPDEKRQSIKLQFGIAVIKFRNPESEDGGYSVCSNIAKIEFVFRNYMDVVSVEGIDNLHTDEGLYKGFRVRVIN